MPDESEREQATRAIAEAFGVPVEILKMTDREFHWWLHDTAAGRALLEADRAQ
jgi:hypothetical protein